MSARFVAACVLVFAGMCLVKAYYSAENRREIVCAPRKKEPSPPPAAQKFEVCRDYVLQQEGSFASHCWHPDHRMEIMASDNYTWKLVKCLCARPTVDKATL